MSDSDTIATIYYIITYVSLAVGIPGNILSAIVWLRRRKTSSAVYLASLAINDLVYTCWSCAFSTRSSAVTMLTVAMKTVGCVWKLAGSL